MSFSRLLFIAVMVAGAAHAEPIVWTFAGNVVGCPSTPEVTALVSCSSPYTPLNGTLRFDNATPPFLPDDGYAAIFNLPGGVFHAEIENLILDGTSMVARIGPNRDEITFEGWIESSNLPGLGGQWKIWIDTYRDGFFGIDRLPATPPRFDPENEFWVDEAMAVWLGVRRSDDDVVADLITTDTQFALRREIPEPNPLALYFGLGVILISMRRLRGSVGLATRRLAAPKPLTVRRSAATP